jgi:hypothetical protein
MQHHNTYIVNTGFILQQNQEKTVIFDSESSYLYTLNETASEIFMLIRKGYKVKKIVEEMVNRYEIAPETAKKDVEQIIDELLELKLIIHA